MRIVPYHPLIARLLMAVILFGFVNFSFAGSMGDVKSKEDVDYLQFLKSHLEFYLPLSGGYGYLKDAQFETAFSGLIRVGIGSRWRVNEKLQLGTEAGFQTGMQMLMNQQTTQELWSNALPLTLIIKSPVDLLVTAKYKIFRSFFLETKGGAAYLNTLVSGADVITSQTWMPAVEAGVGFDFSSKISFLINYQGFFGKTPKLTQSDPFSGVLKLHNIPTWQAIMFTAEIKI